MTEETFASFDAGLTVGILPKVGDDIPECPSTTRKNIPAPAVVTADALYSR